MKTAVLKKNKDKLAKNRNPWVFSGSVYGFDTVPENGETVRVEDADRNFIAYGFFSETSAITLRLFSWEETEPTGYELYVSRIKNALEVRKTFLTPDTDSYRLLYSESDYLPGVIADVFGRHISLQVNTPSAARDASLIAKAFSEVLAPESIYVRPSDELIKKEKFQFTEQCLTGTTPDSTIITENGFKISVNIKGGQKTGYYFDQRENRKYVAGYSAGKNVLDCFCYTGGFSLNCAGKGAVEITSVDSSADALENLKANFALNSLPTPQTVKADIFEYLRQRSADNDLHDIVILDPPKLAKSQNDIEHAMRAYKDLNMLGMKKLKKHGLLASFSCSGRVKREDFIKATAWAAKDAGKNLRIIEQLSQGKDHPVNPFFPESEYLKGIITVVD